MKTKNEKPRRDDYPLLFAHDMGVELVSIEKTPDPAVEKWIADFRREYRLPEIEIPGLRESK